MDRGQIKAIAKHALYAEGSSQGLHVLLLTIIAGVISTIACWGFLLLGGIFAENYEDTLVTVIFLIVGALLASLIGLIAMAIVLHMLMENIKNNKVVKIGDVFSGFEFGLYLKTALYTLVTVFIIALPAVALAGIGSLIAPAIAVILMMVGYIPSIYLGFTFCFVPFAKLDSPSRSFGECMGISKELTKGIKLWIFITGLTMIPCYFWNLIPLVGGILFTMKGYSYILMVSIVTYLTRMEQVGGDIAAEKPVKVKKEKQSKKEKAVKGGAQKKENMQSDKGKTQDNTFEPVNEVKSLQDIMVECIQGAKVVDIVRNGHKVRALPIDIVQKNGVMMYNFFLQTPEGVKPVQVNVEEVTEIIPNGKTFNPAQFVTWTPHWTVPRNW